jgi:hypothetical protein
VSIEGAFSFLRQTLEARVTGDAEGAPDVTLTQPVSTYSFGGDAIVRLTPMAFASGRGVPFILAGGGYFRQLDDQRMLTTSSGFVEAGGGVRYVVWQRPHGFLRAIAIRSDARVIVRSDGFELGASGGAHSTWAVSAGMSAGF